ncbi:ethylbenzene dehydrogenase subunit delta [Aromatoleum toluclasticum]|uniref:ethylbenzene dehydrogenase subunit delta n=1 Tax=Aromatoleum toluclasticum TaxID=92003 RepID=UPI00035C1DA8|nr:ethylbenzene dehydrogenase subunit delta [Aromatoleum toluclasticum]
MSVDAMNSPIELCPRDDRRASAARSQFYKILSGVFNYPADAAQSDFVRRGAAEALRDAAAGLPFLVPAVAMLGDAGGGDVVEAGDEDVALAYTSLFDNCGGRPAVPLHEKDYVQRDTKQVWEELIRFYEHFGLGYDLKASGEWPDHLGTELQFLHYLTFLETGAPDDAAGTYAAAAGDFLERHLANWVPKFADNLAGKAEGAAYVALAQVLVQFVAGEVEWNRSRRALQ